MATNYKKTKNTSKNKQSPIASFVARLGQRKSMVLVFGLLFAGIGSFLVLQSSANTDKSDGTWTRLGPRVRWCESGNNYGNDTNPNSTASGGWQFIDGTWRSYAKQVPGASQYSRAVQAPPNVQDAVAYKLFKANGFGSTASWRASQNCWKEDGVFSKGHDADGKNLGTLAVPGSSGGGGGVIPDQTGGCKAPSSGNLGKDHLAYNQSMGRGQLIRSNNQKYWLTLQSDGNLVFYTCNKAIWHTGTNGNSKVQTVLMQYNGDLSLRGTNPPYYYYWYTGIGGKHPNNTFKLVVQDDGNLVIYSNSKAVWTYRNNGIKASNDTGGGGNTTPGGGGGGGGYTGKGCSTQTVREGNKNECVRQLQEAINVNQPGLLVADGNFGPKTKTAVVNLQRFFSLTADGIAGPKTGGALCYGLATQKKPAPKYCQ